MRINHLDAVTVTPRILDDALAVIRTPEIAAAASESLRRLAWTVASSARGRTIRQCHRPANTSGGPR